MFFCLFIEGISANYNGVDSTSELFGIGSVATIMNVKTQNQLKVNNSTTTWMALNLAGFPVNLFSTKYYLFKKVFMFDVFMLWSSVNLN